MAGVSVTIGANTQDLESAVRRSKTELQSLGKEMQQGIATAAKYGAAAAAAGAAILTGLAVKGLQAVDAQAKLARQLGATNDGLRGLQIAASDAGISSGALSSSLGQLNARIGEAMRGTGTAAASFERLGLSASELSRMDADERMAAIADRMREMGLSTSQAADELRQMGIRNREMVNLMIQGGDAIRGARQEVDDLGLSLSDVDAAMVEQANDSFARLGMLLEGVSQRLAIEVAPVIDAISRMFTDAAKEAGGFGEATSDAFKFVIDSAAFVMNAVDGIKRVFELAADGIIAVWNSRATFIARRIEGILRALDSIPGIDMSNALQSVREFASVSESVVRQAVDNMNDTLMAPMAGTQFKELVAEAREAAEQAARDSVDLSSMLITGGDSTGSAMNEALQKQRDALSKSVEQIRQMGLTETQAIQEKHAEQTKILTEALRHDLLTREQYDEYMVQSAERRDEALAAIGQRERERLNQALEQIREANMTEIELLQQKFEEEQEVIDQALEQQMITDQEWFELMRENKRRHEEELTAIEKAASDERVRQHEREQRAKQQALATAMGNMTTLMNTGSRKMFEIGKAFALAQSIVDGYAAIVGAYKVGASQGGPALGAAYAAAAAAATGARIAAIRSQSFNGGRQGNAGGSGTGSATGNVSAAGQPVQRQQSGTLTVQGISAGSLFTGEAVSELAQELLDYQRRGGNVVLQS